MAEVIKVYRLRPVDGSARVELAPPIGDPHALFFKDSARLLATWSPPAIRLSTTAIERNHEALKLTDVPSGSLGCLIGSRKARAAIEGRFGDFVEFLPLLSNAGEYWAMHVLPSIPAIDEMRSRPLFEDYDLCTLEPVGARVGVQEPYAFSEASVGQLPVFRDSDWRRGWFMTEPFVAFMLGTGLTGFDARLVYDSVLHRKGFDPDGNPAR